MQDGRHFTPYLPLAMLSLTKMLKFIYIKRMGVHLSKKWKMQYSKTVGFIRARMQTCILRSVSLCIRGSRTKWRGAGVEDGAALPYIDRHT
jgi:hypothetical protein